MDSSHKKKEKSQVVVVMVPFPAQGHLNPLLHLTRLIVSNTTIPIPVHYVTTPTHGLQATLRVQGWDPNSISNLHFHQLEVSPNPPDSKTKLPSNSNFFFEITSQLREPVVSLLHSLSSVAKKVILIYDALMALVVQDAANILNIENYTFESSCAFTAFSFIWEEMGKPPLRNSHNFPQVPPLEGRLVPQLMDFITAQREIVKQLSDGSIYNTSKVIESPYLELIEGFSDGKKQWALGPFNPLTIEKKDSKGSSSSSSIMLWLHKQEQSSVIFVSFGTTTTFKEEQVEQIAIGLEQSKQKFIWVLRDGTNELKRHELPNGFEERVEGMGLVVRDYAPQLNILSHPSIGGFISHCGWNSCLESISMGVPIGTWPMHSDQPINSVFIVQVLKIGLVVKDWSLRDELVKASDIEIAVRKLMETKEGDDMRERAMTFKKAIHNSMSEGGASRMEINSFIAHITR